MTAFLRRTADGALTAAALLGLVALLGAVLGAALGARPLVFRSGSMAPTIGTGSLALARDVPATDLRVGDVVSVVAASGARVTHRVVALAPSAGGVRLTLRGDANEVADPDRYVVTSAYRVFWHVPWVGYAVAALTTPTGLLGLGVVVLLLAVSGRGTPSRPGRPGGRRRARRAPAHRRRRVATGLAMVGVAAALAQTAPAMAAPWTDGAAVTGTTFTAATVPAPSSFVCSSVGVLSVTFGWSSVAGATSYTLYYDGGTKTVAAPATSTSITGVVNVSGTAWVVANRSFGGVTWTSVASSTRSYTYLLVASLCG